MICYVTHLVKGTKIHSYLHVFYFIIDWFCFEFSRLKRELERRGGGGKKVKRRRRGKNGSKPTFIIIIIVFLYFTKEITSLIPDTIYEAKFGVFSFVFQKTNFAHWVLTSQAQQ